MIAVTKEQKRALLKLAERVRRACLHKYTAKVIFVPPVGHAVPGCVAITASEMEIYQRLLRMVQRIVPGLNKLDVEHGVGWHWLDRTPYYYSEFSFRVKGAV